MIRLIRLIGLIGLISPMGLVLATDSSSANFILPDSILSDYGGRSSSTVFGHISAGGQTVIGESTSTNFIMRSGFLYFDDEGPARPALSLTVMGLPGGAATEGIVTDVATEAGSVAFGDLNFGEEREAAHRLIVNTNSRNGYQVFIFRRAPLTGPEEIPAIAGTNERPIPWAIAEETSGAFGYHAGDDLLSGGSPRFAPNNTYAALEETPKEIVFSSAPGRGQAVDVVFKIQINEEQAAGDYEAEVGYIAVPVF